MVCFDWEWAVGLADCDNGSLGCVSTLGLSAGGLGPVYLRFLVELPFCEKSCSPARLLAAPRRSRSLATSKSVWDTPPLKDFNPFKPRVLALSLGSRKYSPLRFQPEKSGCSCMTASRDSLGIRSRELLLPALGSKRTSYAFSDITRVPSKSSQALRYD